MADKKTRKTRSDCTVGTFAKVFNPFCMRLNVLLSGNNVVG